MSDKAHKLQCGRVCPLSADNDITVKGRTMALDPETGQIYLVTGDMVINPEADPSDTRHRYIVTPGSALFLDPTN